MLSTGLGGTRVRAGIATKHGQSSGIQGVDIPFTADVTDSAKANVAVWPLSIGELRAARPVQRLVETGWSKVPKSWLDAVLPREDIPISGIFKLGEKSLRHSNMAVCSVRLLLVVLLRHLEIFRVSLLL